MSYEKLGFEKGQTLKAEHLNHIEEGIANASGYAAVVQIGFDDNHTGNLVSGSFQEIVEAFRSGEIPKILATRSNGDRFYSYQEYSFIEASVYGDEGYIVCRGINSIDSYLPSEFAIMPDNTINIPDSDVSQ